MRAHLRVDRHNIRDSERNKEAFVGEWVTFILAWDNVGGIEPIVLNLGDYCGRSGTF